MMQICSCGSLSLTADMFWSSGKDSYCGHLLVGARSLTGKAGGGGATVTDQVSFYADDLIVFTGDSCRYCSQLI